MTLKFVPPKEEAQSFPRYASYGAGQLKTHGTLAGARNSLNNRTAPYWNNRDKVGYKQGFILENIEGEWYTLWHVPEGTMENDLPWVHKRWVNIKYGWKYDHNPSVGSTYHKAEDYREEYYSRPMTTDEYVAWRLAVERERLGITQ